MIEKVYRPWGWYENIQEESSYKVKRLFISPNQKISLQYHKHRDEHWIVVFGDGVVEVNDVSRSINIGDYIFVPLNSSHRVTGGDNGIMIIEIQLGEICDENDIVRIQDDYGRV
jgi:mannose-6-phosphate isomerase-like protein (cupin superfamily)